MQMEQVGKRPMIAVFELQIECSAKRDERKCFDKQNTKTNLSVHGTKDVPQIEHGYENANDASE